MGVKKMIANCIILQCRSYGTYELIRARNIFHLPCKTTLKAYTAKSTGEVGVTALVQKRQP